MAGNSDYAFRGLNGNCDRRLAIKMTAAASVSLMFAGAEAEMTDKTMIAMKSLEFDASSVPGLSERLLSSHHQNNYGGAVRKLAAIEAELAGAPLHTLPGFRINGLKREELIAHNSIVLHEIYFAGLAGEAAPSKTLAKAIGASFGSLDAWRNEFAAMGKALAGGSGWALLTWSPRAGRLINAWAADHSMSAAGGVILAALDMYEHAYALDYGADAGAYVDAYVRALKWTAASRAFEAVK